MLFSVVPPVKATQEDIFAPLWLRAILNLMRNAFGWFLGMTIDTGYCYYTNSLTLQYNRDERGKRAVTESQRQTNGGEAVNTAEH